MTDPLADRVSVLRQLSGELQAGRSPAVQWLGRCLSDWLRTGGDLPALLGVRPGRGSRRTAQELIRRDELRRLMLDLSRNVGGDRNASRLLRGMEPTPDAVREIVDRLHQLDTPTSTRAFIRARKVTTHRA